MKKKVLAGLLAAAVSLSVVAGCGNRQSGTDSNADSTGGTQESPSDSNTEKGNSGGQKEVTLTFGFYGDDPEAEMKMSLANAYMEAHPNVKMEFEYCTGADYLTKLQTWFSSGDAPDVFALASDQLFPYRDSPLFEDLAPYIERDGCGEYWDMESVEAAWKTDDGRIVAAPFLSKTFGIAYNKSLFDRAGLAYPDESWTETEMLDAAEKINALGDDIYGIRWGTFVPEFYRNLYGNMIYDVDIMTMNAAENEEFKAAVTMFADVSERSPEIPVGEQRPGSLRKRNGNHG